MFRRSLRQLYKYFGEVEVKQSVAVIRLDGPGKMNTLNEGMQQAMHSDCAYRTLTKAAAVGIAATMNRMVRRGVPSST